MYLLVHGAAGFVAQSLLPLVVEAGYNKLILLDRKEIPVQLLKLLRHKGADVSTERGESIANVRSQDVSAVVCLAGATSVDAALADPMPAMAQNITIALDLAEWLRTAGRPMRTVYMSSDEVLGVSVTALREDAPLLPTQPYATSKAAAELILHDFRDVYGLRIATLRSCNLIGANQRGAKLIPTAVKALRSGLPVPIHGTGLQMREWLAVEDVCRAIVRLLDPTAPVGVYQAGSGIHLSVLRVAELVSQALGVPLAVQHIADRSVQDSSYAMDFSKLKLLGWKPSKPPEKAIAEAAQNMAVEFEAAGFPR